MYESWFTYPITKPYPFRWFTPVVIVGGVILAVLLSFVNLASNGYYLKPTYAENPNATVASGSQWYMKAPFNWNNDFKAQCQPEILSVGDRFFSSTLGLQYEIQSVVRVSDWVALPSIPYLNNPLEDCRLQSATFNFQKADHADPPSWWLSWVASTAAATASCRITTDQGAINVTLAVQYDGGDVPGDVPVINKDPKEHASTWWGQKLVYNYFWGAVLLMSQIEIDKDHGNYLTRGQIIYRRNESEENIKSSFFFREEHWFVSDTAKIINTDEKIFVPVKDEGRHHGRLLQSLVSLDLGNCHSPNILLDQGSLEYAIIDPNSTSRSPGGILYGEAEGTNDPSRAVTISYPDSLNETAYLSEAYEKISPMMGELGCKDATIVTQYLCSTPQQKSVGSMLLSILLANLVFLQAAWKILNWIAGGILWKKGVE